MELSYTKQGLDLIGYIIDNMQFDGKYFIFFKKT